MFSVDVLLQSHLLWCLKVTLVTFEYFLQLIFIFRYLIQSVLFYFFTVGMKVLAAISPVASTFVVEVSTIPSVPSFTSAIFTFSFFLYILCNLHCYDHTDICLLLCKSSDSSICTWIVSALIFHVSLCLYCLLEIQLFDFC